MVHVWLLNIVCIIELAWIENWKRLETEGLFSEKGSRAIEVVTDWFLSWLEQSGFAWKLCKLNMREEERATLVKSYQLNLIREQN